MEISVTFKDQSPEDLMIQHLAEQKDAGHVVDWIYGLIYAAIEAHPDYRVCPDLEDCCEHVYPTMTVCPVANSTWKKYRVATAPTLVCPRCGRATITQGQLNKRMKADPHRQQCIADGKARMKEFAEGAPDVKQAKPQKKPGKGALDLLSESLDAIHETDQRRRAIPESERAGVPSDVLRSAFTRILETGTDRVSEAGVPAFV